VELSIKSEAIEFISGVDEKEERTLSEFPPPPPPLELPPVTIPFEQENKQKKQRKDMALNINLIDSILMELL